ncbi:MAG: alkyl hydroperoxide reductase subunit F, partial [Spirochaetae bacterium HGW-Spirochaetae-6]
MQLVFKTEEKSADLRTALNYEHTYDLVILGAGPAGLTAALYALRKKLDTALISKDIGGQLLSTWDLENYMGFRKIEGFGLTKKFEEQVSQFPLAFAEGYSLTSLSKTSDSIFEATLDNGQTVRSRSIILATGKKWRPLGVPGEEEYTGKGVAYCATCDAPLYKNKKVIV